jgi:hypothetical protein
MEGQGGVLSISPITGIVLGDSGEAFLWSKNLRSVGGADGKGLLNGTGYGNSPPLLILKTYEEK